MTLGLFIAILGMAVGWLTLVDIFLRWASGDFK